MPKTGLDALLRPEDSILVLIDHQPYQFTNLNSHEPTMIINNVIGLAKTAKVFNVPTILTTVIEERGGYQFMPEWNTRPANHYLPRVTTSASGCGSGGCSCKDADTALTMPESVDAQLERGELHLASMATRISP